MCNRQALNVKEFSLMFYMIAKLLILVKCCFV